MFHGLRAGPYDNGSVVIVVPTKDGCANMPLKDLYRIGASIVGVNSLLYSAVESAAMLRRIVPAFEAGQLVAPDGIEERPLEAGPAVYVELKSGSPCKFVLVPGS